MVTVTPVMSRYVVTSQERGDSGGEGGAQKGEEQRLQAHLNEAS